VVVHDKDLERLGAGERRERAAEEAAVVEARDDHHDAGVAVHRL
jgi:hypothetical protein